MSDTMRLLTSKKIYWHQEDPYREWGDLWLQVSIFNHYLKEAEMNNPLMFYRLACESGVEAEYLDGENRWLTFCRYLSREGATIGGVDGLRLINLRSTSGRLRKIIIDSLRERRLMNVIFKAEPVRVLGGHDRTDFLLPPNVEVRERLKLIAKDCGLHALN